MKILLTGGGTGGHFFPIIAIIQALRELEREKNLVDVDLYYAGDMPFNKRFFLENQVEFKPVKTGKRRLYFSVANVFDIFKTIVSFFDCLWYLYRLFPDVVFSKGGSVSFPILLSARLLGIPVMIHESDSAPGRTNLWASKFAKSVAISYPEAADYFPEEKTVLTGNPLRKEVLKPVNEGAEEFLKLEEDLPVIAILGGSQGAENINNAIFAVLPKLLEKYQIIHQVGEKNIPYVESVLEGVLANSEHRYRYKYFGHLNDLAMKMTAGASDLIISRAGSTIFEIAVWGKPSIIIPIRRSNGNHQTKNAYYYARAGAALVVEEENLTPNLLAIEIDRLMEDSEAMEKMSKAALAFANTDAAKKIAEELVRLALHFKSEEEKAGEEDSQKKKKESKKKGGKKDRSSNEAEVLAPPNLSKRKR